jgi:hypothetical protein
MTFKVGDIVRVTPSARPSTQTGWEKASPGTTLG